MPNHPSATPHLLHREALQNLELLARQVVEGFIIGLHRSPFHGFSAEFAEHRLYNAGDPLRHVDWKVFGRTDRLFLKRYEEETNLRCCLVIDRSASMHFPDVPGRLTKFQFSVVAAAALLQVLSRQRDAAGLAFYGNGLESLSPVRSSHRHIQELTSQLQQALKVPPATRQTQGAEAIHELAGRLHRRSLVAIFTDVLESGEATDAFLDSLQHLRFYKHEVVLFQVVDAALERDFAFEERPYEFVDAESDLRIKLTPAELRSHYQSAFAAFEEKVRNFCLHHSIDYVPVDVAAPVAEVLRAFLVKRQRMA